MSIQEHWLEIAHSIGSDEFSRILSENISENDWSSISVLLATPDKGQLFEILEAVLSDDSIVNRHVDKFLWFFLADPDLRSDAIEYLTSYPKQEFIPLIVGILLLDRKQINRICACECIAENATPEFAPVLTCVLGDKNYLVRAYSAYGLARIDSQNALSVLNSQWKVERNLITRTSISCSIATIEKDGRRLIDAVMNSSDHYSLRWAINYIELGLERGFLEEKVVNKELHQLQSKLTDPMSIDVINKFLCNQCKRSDGDDHTAG